MRSQELTQTNSIFGASARAKGRNVRERLRALEALCPFPLESESVEAAFLVEVLDHVNSVERSLAELRRVLKPRAKAYVSVPNALFPLETHPIRISDWFFHPWMFPLLNWTPFHDAVATARIFHKNKLAGLFESLGLRVIASDYMVAPLEYRFSFLRPILAVIGRTPFKPLVGVSLVFALEKICAEPGTP